MDWQGATIGLAVVAGIAIVVVIPILIWYILKQRKNIKCLQDTGHVLTEIQQEARSIKQLDSLPCRLKKGKSNSNGHGIRSAAGESGVYDMSELSSIDSRKEMIAVSHLLPDGTDLKLYLFGELTQYDILLIKSVTSHYIMSMMKKNEAENGIIECKMSQVNLDDIVVTGFASSPFTYINDGFSPDEIDNKPTRTSLSQTLSSLSKKKRNKRERVSKDSQQNKILLGNANPITTRISTVIGPSGGELQLCNKVKLTVPCNALAESVEITLGVTFNEKHKPQVTDEETLLTPIVFCQPSGLKFKEPVTVTLPHCAENLQERWRANILCSQTDVESEETKWKALQIGEYESRSFSTSHVELCVDHFTMFCLSGTSKPNFTSRKKMKLVGLLEASTYNNVDVFCINNYNHLALQGDSLLLEPSGQSVKLVMENPASGSLSGDQNKQEMSFEDAWHESYSPVSFSFHNKVDEGYLPEGGHSYDISAWQIGNASPKYRITANSSSLSDHHSHKHNGNSQQKKRHVFSETLRWDIILLLDTPHPEGNDWRRLAQEIGISDEFIKVMEEKPSPTKELLSVYEEKGHGCIKSFVALAVKINRLDLAEKIEEHVGKLYLETLPNHKCNESC